MATEDFGINDPNLLQLIESGINNPAAVAALLKNDGGATLIPGMRRRQDAAAKSFLEMLAENNTARALLSNKKQDIEARKNDQTYTANMMNHAPGLAKEGILSSASPYDIFFRRPGVETSDRVNIEGKQAYNANQRMEAMERGANAGYVTDEGAQLDPNKPRLPVTTRDGGRATSVLAALARANANDGKRVDQYGPNDEFLGSTVTRTGGHTPASMAQPGQQREIAPPPAAEQAIRAKISAINPKLSKVPIGYDPTTKSYVARYQAADGEKIIRIPADPSRRPMVDKLTVE